MVGFGVGRAVSVTLGCSRLGDERYGLWGMGGIDIGYGRRGVRITWSVVLCGSRTEYKK